MSYRRQFVTLVQARFSVTIVMMVTMGEGKPALVLNQRIY